jgi:hypothetical protein
MELVSYLVHIKTERREEKTDTVPSLLQAYHRLEESLEEEHESSVWHPETILYIELSLLYISSVFHSLDSIIRIREKAKYLKKNLCQCQLFHHKFDMMRLNPGLPKEKLEPNCVSYDIIYYLSSSYLHDFRELSIGIHLELTNIKILSHHNKVILVLMVQDLLQ